MPETITIPVEEYKKLTETYMRVKIFSEFVNRQKYSIDKKDCGYFLGFEVADGEG